MICAFATTAAAAAETVAAEVPLVALRVDAAAGLETGEDEAAAAAAEEVDGEDEGEPLCCAFCCVCAVPAPAPAVMLCAGVCCFCCCAEVADTDTEGAERVDDTPETVIERVAGARTDEEGP